MIVAIRYVLFMSPFLILITSGVFFKKKSYECSTRERKNCKREQYEIDFNKHSHGSLYSPYFTPFLPCFGISTQKLRV